MTLNYSTQLCAVFCNDAKLSSTRIFATSILRYKQNTRPRKRRSIFFWHLSNINITHSEKESIMKIQRNPDVHKSAPSGKSKKSINFILILRYRSQKEKTFTYLQLPAYRLRPRRCLKRCNRHGVQRVEFSVLLFCTMWPCIQQVALA